MRHAPKAGGNEHVFAPIPPEGGGAEHTFLPDDDTAHGGGEGNLLKGP
jgi:hypothetical protein